MVTGDGSRTLRLGEAGESYKSLAGALTEARDVYLNGSGAARRLAAGKPTRILEIGFGTGLLFLVTAIHAQAGGAPLEHVALERELPAAESLAALGYDELLAPSELPAALLAWRRGLGEAPPRGPHTFERPGVRLTLHLQDARDLPSTGPGFHAIYHDAFSPRTNPALWSTTFLASLAARLEAGGRLVSFSVAGAVRRDLGAAGLEVRKVPGPPGGKREVLVAERPAP